MLKDFWSNLVELVLGTVEAALRAAADRVKTLKEKITGLGG